ncbi:hypothetical protein [Escherichia coli]|uniref:hypothetical protein n=1 Tax=Escherichia coli TaxID=562 RepID=UPI00388DD561
MPFLLVSGCDQRSLRGCKDRLTPSLYICPLLALLSGNLSSAPMPFGIGYPRLTVRYHGVAGCLRWCAGNHPVG